MWALSRAENRVLILDSAKPLLSRGPLAGTARQEEAQRHTEPTGESATSSFKPSVLGHVPLCLSVVFFVLATKGVMNIASRPNFAFFSQDLVVLSCLKNFVLGTLEGGTDRVLRGQTALSSLVQVEVGGDGTGK